MLVSIPLNQPETRYVVELPGYKVEFYFRVLSIADSPRENEEDRYYWTAKVTYPLLAHPKYGNQQQIYMNVYSTNYTWGNPLQAYDGMVNIFRDMGMVDISKALKDNRERIKKEAWENSLSS